MTVIGLPFAAAALLVSAATAAASHGALGPADLLILVSLIVAAGAFAETVSEAAPTAAVVGVIGWMVANSFGSAPYGSLRPDDSWAPRQAVVVAAATALGVALGAISRRVSQPREPRRSTLDAVSGLAGLAAAVAPRRRGYAVLVALVSMPLLTLALTAGHGQLDLADDLLIYLIVVVAVSVIGGLWPAVATAVAASLLLNWFFTVPFHTFTIDKPDNLLALLLFIVVAVSVSSIVHLAARRAQLAARSRAESEGLLRLARLVLGGQDNPTAILEHLHQIWTTGLELQELVSDTWTRVAAAGDLDCQPDRLVVPREGLRLVVHGELPRGSERLVEAAAAQSAAALDRDRLRTQAAQAEALAAGNLMRTALLAAVSHDLRTPLASLKASVSSLRQTDVAWSPSDTAELLENVEDSTDRLTDLIANLLDMSRVQTGALQPYLRPAALEEIVPTALAGVAGQETVILDLPEDLPLLRTDPGLLERALANLLSNALRHSPAGQPPTVVASVAPSDDEAAGPRVAISVIDHGPGVAVTDRARIFEPFQRLGDQSPGTGIGLGLAVARGFVESLGGSLTAADTPGGGLTMTVTVPSSSGAELPQPMASR